MTSNHHRAKNAKGRAPTRSGRKVYHSNLKKKGKGRSDDDGSLLYGRNHQAGRPPIHFERGRLYRQWSLFHEEAVIAPAAVFEISDSVLTLGPDRSDQRDSLATNLKSVPRYCNPVTYLTNFRSLYCFIITIHPSKRLPEGAPYCKYTL